MKQNKLIQCYYCEIVSSVKYLSRAHFKLNLR